MARIRHRSPAAVTAWGDTLGALLALLTIVGCSSAPTRPRTTVEAGPSRQIAAPAAAPADRDESSRPLVADLPAARIVSPVPQAAGFAATPPILTVRWQPVEDARQPTHYWILLVNACEIDPTGGDPPAARVENYLRQSLAGESGRWTRLSSRVTEWTLRDLVPDDRYFFAVVAAVGRSRFDDTFDPGRNVLAVRPTLEGLGPRIAITSGAFHYEMPIPGVALAPVGTVAATAGQPVTFRWEVLPSDGIEARGSRWALDILDIADETPRSGQDDLAHWSVWDAEGAATVGPFAGGEEHFLYVMARDQLGLVSLVVVRIEVFSP